MSTNDPNHLWNMSPSSFINTGNNSSGGSFQNLSQMAAQPKPNPAYVNPQFKAIQDKYMADLQARDPQGYDLLQQFNKLSGMKPGNSPITHGEHGEQFGGGPTDGGEWSKQYGSQLDSLRSQLDARGLVHHMSGGGWLDKAMDGVDKGIGAAVNYGVPAAVMAGIGYGGAAAMGAGGAAGGMGTGAAANTDAYANMAAQGSGWGGGGSAVGGGMGGAGGDTLFNGSIGGGWGTAPAATSSATGAGADMSLGSQAGNLYDVMPGAEAAAGGATGGIGGSSGGLGSTLGSIYQGMGGINGTLGVLGLANNIYQNQQNRNLANNASDRANSLAQPQRQPYQNLLNQYFTGGQDITKQPIFANALDLMNRQSTARMAAQQQTGNQGAMAQEFNKNATQQLNASALPYLQQLSGQAGFGFPASTGSGQLYGQYQNQANNQIGYGLSNLFAGLNAGSNNNQNNANFPTGYNSSNSSGGGGTGSLFGTEVYSRA